MSWSCTFPQGCRSSSRRRQACPKGLLSPGPAAHQPQHPAPIPPSRRIDQSKLGPPPGAEQETSVNRRYFRAGSRAQCSCPSRHMTSRSLRTANQLPRAPRVGRPKSRKTPRQTQGQGNRHHQASRETPPPRERRSRRTDRARTAQHRSGERARQASRTREAPRQKSRYSRQQSAPHPEVRSSRLGNLWSHTLPAGHPEEPF